MVYVCREKKRGREKGKEKVRKGEKKENGNGIEEKE